MPDVLVFKPHAVEAWIEVERPASEIEPHRWERTRKLCDVLPHTRTAIAVDRKELEAEAIANDAPRARCVAVWPDGVCYPVMYADRPSGPWPTD